MKSKNNMIKFFPIDEGVLFLTGAMTFFSFTIQDINLIFSLVVKVITAINFAVYVILNYERIIDKVKRFLKKIKFKK